MTKKTQDQIAQEKYNQLMDLFKTCPKEEWDAFVKAIEALRPKTFNYKAPKNVGVGVYIRSLIRQGYANKDVLKLVETCYSNNNTTYACVAWYRNDMIKKGLIAKAA